MLWTGDAYDQPSTAGIGDLRISRHIDKLLCVSNWHARTLCEESGFPMEKSWVIRNGIKLSLFEGSEKRTRKRLVYSSTPYRGLKHLLQIFPAILKLHADAELHIFSGYDVYKGTQEYPANVIKEFQALKESFSKIPNVFFRGNLTQPELAREFMQASVLAYPNTFDETSCITAMEAQAGGCAVVSSNKGALPETVANAGILIDGEPGSIEYNSQFISAIDRILSDDELFSSLTGAGRKRLAEEFDWGKVAERFSAYLQSLLS